MPIISYPLEGTKQDSSYASSNFNACEKPFPYNRVYIDMHASPHAHYISRTYRNSSAIMSSFGVCEMCLYVTLKESVNLLNL